LLLATVYSRRMKLIATLTTAAALGVTVTLGSGASAQDRPDRNVFGWYMGMQIRPSAIVPQAYGNPKGPKGPSKKVPDVTVYTTGVVDKSVPSGPSRRLPKPGGGTMVLPQHQLTLSKLVPKARKDDAMGVFVVPGPRATKANVRTRKKPRGSMVGAPLAYEINVGDVAWAKLNNHLVIEYGVKLGLLKLKRFDYGGLMWTSWPDNKGFAASCKTVKAPPGFDAVPPGIAAPDKNVFGWYAGLAIRPNSIVPKLYGNPNGPEDPSPDVPDLTVNLVGPLNDSTPAGPMREGIPRPDGTRKTLPTHQLTIGALAPGSGPYDAMGRFIVPGPNATRKTVKARPDVPNSIPGAPLAYAIKVGTAWSLLDSHVTVEYGLARGLLKVVPFEFGGTMWTVLADDVAWWAGCG
jgi:hypothetical protein